MDAISITGLAGLITQAAAGEAGRTAWDGLVKIAKVALRRSQTAPLDATKTAQPAQALELAGNLIQRAAIDADLKQLLLAWINSTSNVTSDDSVTNLISGEAIIHGDVLQARDTGSVSFGNRDDMTR